MVDGRPRRHERLNFRRALRWTAWLCLRLALVLIVLTLGAAIWLVFDARRTPTGNPEYVALGSSYAAGAGLGPRQSGSPILCSRSINGYPPRLARRLRVSLVDRTCSGSVTRHVLDGGQFFQEAQIRVLGPQTRLVTITAGGNDVGFVRDLYLLALRNSDSALGRSVRRIWNGPPALVERDFAQLHDRLSRLIREVRRRSPAALVVIATYPPVLPASGTCRVLHMTASEAKVMREVQDRLTVVTRQAATSEGAAVVDMSEIGADHSACSAVPWTKGWGDIRQSPFHPNLNGAQATADAIAVVFSSVPQH